MRPTAEPLAIDTVVFAQRLRTRGAPQLHDLELNVLPGEIFVMVGRADSGAVAVLEAIVGLRPADADALIVCGHDPRALPSTVRQRIGVAVRRSGLERRVRVEEAVRLFASFYERHEPVRELLDRMGLLAHRRTFSSRLSPDAAQRLALALALLNDPVVLFVEDPTRDLDPASARFVWELLRERRRRGRTVVVATSSLEEAERIADRVAILDAGRILAADSPSALLARFDGRVIVTFELSKPPIALDVLNRLDGVTEVACDGDAHSLWSTDGFMTARALIRLLDATGARPRTLAMRYPSLEDVYFRMVPSQS